MRCWRGCARCRRLTAHSGLPRCVPSARRQRDQRAAGRAAACSAAACSGGAQRAWPACAVCARRGGRATRCSRARDHPLINLTTGEREKSHRGTVVTCTRCTEFRQWDLSVAVTQFFSCAESNVSPGPARVCVCVCVALSGQRSPRAGMGKSSKCCQGAPYA